MLFSWVTVLEGHFSTYTICLDRILLLGLKQPWKDFWLLPTRHWNPTYSNSIRNWSISCWITFKIGMSKRPTPLLCNCVIDSLLWWMYGVQNSSLSKMPRTNTLNVLHFTPKEACKCDEKLMNLHVEKTSMVICVDPIGSCCILKSWEILHAQAKLWLYRELQHCCYGQRKQQAKICHFSMLEK